MFKRIIRPRTDGKHRASRSDACRLMDALKNGSVVARRFYIPVRGPASFLAATSDHVPGARKMADIHRDGLAR
jgi:hypothetical protein